MIRALPAMLLLLVGCEELQQATPDVRFDTLRIDDIDFDQVDSEFVFQVDNPNPVEVSLASFSYDLELETVSLLSGEEPEGLRLPALDSAEVRLPATLVWRDVYDSIQATRGEDEVDFGLAGRFGFMTPWGELALPYQTDGRFPALRTPRFRLGKLRVAEVDVLAGKADVALELGIDNDHGSTLTFSELDYAVSFAGREVADGLVPSLASVDGATERVVEVPLTIDLIQAGTAIVSVLTRGDRLDAGIDATVDVDTPFGQLPLTVDETGQVEVVRE